MAEPNARPDGMAIGISGRPTPETSLRWVGQGPIRRILFNSLSPLRKKIFIESIYFIIIYPRSRLVCPKTIKCSPPPAFPVGCASYNIPPPLLPRVFGWLLCVSIVQQPL
jgi:hypothetical protein